MDIRKTVSAVIVATMVLSMTACANSEKPSGNDGGTMQTGSNSTNNSIPLIQDGEKEPTKKLGIWDVLPEIPVTDASAFTYKYDSELGGMVVTDYLRESPKVRIPDKLEGYPVVKVDFIGVKKELTQLVMPDTVKGFSFSITMSGTLQCVNHPRDKEEVYFSECKKLEAVYIPDNVSEIRDSAFSSCKSLSNIIIPDSVTSIGSCAFQACTSLASITIPDSVTSIGNGAFRGCTSLESISIPDGVTAIYGSNLSGTFSGCTSLTSVTIPDSVTSIGYGAFRECTSLTSITIPDSVTKIGDYAFSYCYNIQATYKGKTYDYEHIGDLYKAINGN